MTSELQTLRELICRYQAEVTQRVARLRATLNRDDLLRGWREGAYPQEGPFGSEGNEYYSFHGTGCAVEDDDVVVDFEFGSGGRIDGFDAWRLHLFVQNFQDEYPSFEDAQSIELAIDRLVEAGELSRPNELPNRELVYLTEQFQIPEEQV